ARDRRGETAGRSEPQRLPRRRHARPPRPLGAARPGRAAARARVRRLAPRHHGLLRARGRRAIRGATSHGLRAAGVEVAPRRPGRASGRRPRGDARPRRRSAAPAVAGPASRAPRQPRPPLAAHRRRPRRAGVR
ncbi:hypothetical protein LTR16_012001, partial [Cryomyces antarcticus]